MKKRRIGFVFVLVLMFIAGLGMGVNNASAAKYGAKAYTTPKVLRGTWKLQKSKNYSNSGVSSRMLSPYKKIKITKHTITFYRKAGKSALKGKYKLYKVPNRQFSAKQRATANIYAAKHKWLAPFNTNSKGFEFSKDWLYIFQSTATGGITSTGKKTMTFANAFYKDTFKKQ